LVVKVAPLLPGKTSDPGRTGSDNRLFVNGCLWVLRSGAHWRDLPERYGRWKTVHRRFNCWCHAGVTAGQVGDVTQASALLDGQTGDAVLADKAYDSNDLRAIIAEISAEAVIPSNRPRKIAIPHDAVAYRQRYRIERCFNRLKHFRRFATRYERRTIHFAGFLFLAAAMIWMQ